MNIFKFAALALMFLMPIGAAQAEMVIEAGSYNAAPSSSSQWDSAYGTLDDADGKSDTSEFSIASRYEVGNVGGLIFGAGVRAGTAEYVASYGAAAQHDDSVAAQAQADATVALNDAIAAEDLEAQAVAQAEYDAATATRSTIDSMHRNSADVVGGSFTVEKEFLLASGKRVRVGSEVFKPTEGDAVPAARLSYLADNGPVSYRVIATVGDGWAGASLGMGF